MPSYPGKSNVTVLLGVIKDASEIISSVIYVIPVISKETGAKNLPLFLIL
jgi:hypothetical protein